MKKLIALLSAASGLTESALASCVNGDSSINAEELDKVLPKVQQGIEAKLNKAKEDATTEANKAHEGKTFEDGRTNGKLEAERKLSKALREQFGIEDSKLSGDDLIKAIAANKDKAPEKITKDMVERQPWYQEEQEKREKSHKEEIAKMKGEHDEFKNQVSRKERLGEMRKRATVIIEELNLNLAKDAARRAGQMEIIMKALEADDYEFKDDAIKVLRDGKVLRDKMDNSVPFKEHVSAIATGIYEPLESKERESPGVKNQQKEGTKKVWTRDMPKTDEEYAKLLVDESIPEDEREALMAQRSGK